VRDCTDHFIHAKASDRKVCSFELVVLCLCVSQPECMFLLPNGQLCGQWGGDPEPVHSTARGRGY